MSPLFSHILNSKVNTFHAINFTILCILAEPECSIFQSGWNCLINTSVEVWSQSKIFLNIFEALLFLAAFI